MNKSIFQLLGNIALVDYYLCEGNNIVEISDNNAHDMQAFAREALRISVTPNTLTIIALKNFQVVMIPIDHKRTLIMIPHINSDNISFNYQEITKYASNIYSLSSLSYQLITNHKSPTWKVHFKEISTSCQKIDFLTNEDIKTGFLTNN